ncbi:MAG: FAD-binding oxidoreductase, partial [Parvibaculum sp.]
NTLILTLAPITPADALCQFMPGQYLDILPPDTGWLARAYSIGNAPRDDGSVELQVRHVMGGRLTHWLFEGVHEGDVVKARGPQGRFTLRSIPGKPLVFVAGGTGLAPINALIEQQLVLGLTGDIQLFWGVNTSEDLYELDILASWTKRDARVHATLVVDHGPLPDDLAVDVRAVSGSLADALATSSASLTGFDAYIAGPPAMMSSVVDALAQAGVQRERIRVDSFGL